MMADTFGVGVYSPRVAARVAKLRYQSFQAWAKANLLHPIFQIKVGQKKVENVYSYHDLLLIRLISRLRARGFRAKVIKGALDTIAMMSEGDRDAWLRCTFCVDGNMIVVFFPDKREWNPIAASKGPQKLECIFFPELLDELKRDLVPARFRYVEVDPEVMGGNPTIKGTRIPTDLIYQIKKSGQDPKEAYPQLTLDEINDAEAYEEFLVAA